MIDIRLAAAALFLAGCTPAAAPDAQPPAGGEPQGLSLSFPLACEPGVSCELQNYVDRDPGPGAVDYHCGRRTYDGHNGVDIRLPDMAAQRAGVDVLAAANGRVARLRDGVADVSIRAAGAPKVEGQECGNGVVLDHGGGWETQYCHLAQSSLAVKVGDTVTAGQPIAKVGLSGNTEFAHLHISVGRAGVVVDPFAPDPAANTSCQPRGGLWAPAAAKAMTYRAGAVLNAGFAAGPVTMDAVEAGLAPPPSAEGPALVAFVRAIGLEGGDELELTLKGPGGEVLAHSRTPPLDRDKAQHLLFVGKKRPPAGWPHGTYTASYVAHRRGKAAMTQVFEIAI